MNSRNKPVVFYFFVLSDSIADEQTRWIFNAYQVVDAVPASLLTPFSMNHQVSTLSSDFATLILLNVQIQRSINCKQDPSFVCSLEKLFFFFSFFRVWHSYVCEWDTAPPPGAKFHLEIRVAKWRQNESEIRKIIAVRALTLCTARNSKAIRNKYVR